MKVYGAFRVSVKMLLMLNSQIQVDGGGNDDVATSVLEVRNLVVLKVIPNDFLLQLDMLSVLEGCLLQKSNSISSCSPSGCRTTL